MLDCELLADYQRQKLEPHSYLSRLRRLKQLEDLLSTRYIQLQLQLVAHNSPDDFELPELNSLTGDEWQLVNTSVDRITSTWSECLSSAVNLVTRIAAMDRLFFGVFRFLQTGLLNKTLLRLEATEELLKKEEQVKSQNLEKICKGFLKRPISGGALKKLRQIYATESATSLRVNQLNREIRNKKQELLYMKNWLADSKIRIRKKVCHKAPTLRSFDYSLQSFPSYGLERLFSLNVNINQLEESLETLVIDSKSWEDWQFTQTEIRWQ